MKTYNVKTVSEKLNLPIPYVYKCCKKLGIKKRLNDFGYTKLNSYELTDDEIEAIRSLPYNARRSAYRDIAKEVGLNSKQVQCVAGKVKRYVKGNEAVLTKACLLWKTKEFTLKGLLNRL